MQFTDHMDRELINKADVEDLWQVLVPAWVDVNSQGRYQFESEVIDWVVTDNTEAYYSFGKQGLVPETQQMGFPILSQLDGQNFDWSQFDSDNDGRIDSLVMIHSGYGAETTREDCFGKKADDRIWAHAYTNSANPWMSSDGNYQTGGYTIASAFFGECGAEPNKLGLSMHEFMHTLGKGR